jgi:hypothetical protein
MQKNKKLEPDVVGGVKSVGIHWKRSTTQWPEVVMVEMS